MAKKKEVREEAPDDILVAAAKSVGTAAGKIAAAVGLATPPQPKVPRLATFPLKIRKAGTDASAGQADSSVAT
jgi:hypothetical protein